MNRRWVLPAVLCAGLAACASQPSQRYLGPPVPAPARCLDCGRVERIEVVNATGVAHGNGAVLGGVLGGVLSNPAGKDSAQLVKHDYRISVRMDDGRRLTITQGLISSNLKEGSPVRIDHGRVVLMR